MTEKFKDYAQYKTQSGTPLVDAIAAWTTSETFLASLLTLAQHRLDFKNSLSGANGAMTHCPTLTNGVDPPKSAADLGPAEKDKATKILAEITKLNTARKELPACPILQVDSREPKDFDDKAFLDKLGAYTDELAPFVKAQCDDAAAVATNKKLFPQWDAFCTGLQKSAHAAAQYRSNVSAAQAAGKGHTQAEQQILKDFETEIGKIRIENPTNAAGTVHPGYAENASLYISADVGFMTPVFPSTGEVAIAPFVGANFYFGPVDKDEPLDWTRGFEARKRLALTAGLAFSLKDSAGTVKGALSAGAPFVGGGIRLSDYLRFVGGGVFVLQKDANPLITNERVRVLPYLGASVDLDVAGTIKTMFSTGQSSL